MMNLKCLLGRHRQILWAVCLLATGSLGFGPALADDTRLDDGAKKAGNNFGELLKGMGQELKKVGGSLSQSGKKNDPKGKPSSGKEPDKDEKNSR